jgi:hypothetical protein
MPGSSGLRSNAPKTAMVEHAFDLPQRVIVKVRYFKHGRSGALSQHQDGDPEKLARQRHRSRLRYARCALDRLHP